MTTIASAPNKNDNAGAVRFVGRSATMRPLNLAAVAFFVFGVLLTANSQITSGGTWTLYAKLMQQGERPYSDLHLPQQPLFFLFNRAWYAIAGENWLLSQVPAALVLALFCWAYFLLARRIPWPTWQQSIVFLGASLSAIGWTYYSFFDYRAFTDIFALYTLLLLLGLDDGKASEISAKRSLAFGCLCGLSFTTRANDGLMLLIAVAAILLHWFPRQFLRNMALLFAGAAATVLAVVLIMGDTIGGWFEYTLHSVSAMKGGSGQVLLSPLILVADIFHYLNHPFVLLFGTAFFAMTTIPAWVVAASVKSADAPSTRGIILLVVAIALFEGGWLTLLGYIASYSALPNTSLPWFQLFLICLSIWAALGVLGLLNVENRLFDLVLIPGGALVAAGMSSGGDHISLYGPIGLLLVLLPIIAGETMGIGKRAMILAVCMLLATTIFIGKVRVPMEWEHYRAKPLFMDRAWVNLPGKGPMLVEREMDRHFSDVCRTVSTNGVGNGLLSLPYSYANYYCGIAPWRMYVQTYFDTSSAATIDGLMQALDASPPTWIVYQRQLDKIRATELAFNHGQPIRHRALDQDIRNHVQRGEWTIVRHWSDRPKSDWYFIRTSPP